MKFKSFIPLIASILLAGTGTEYSSASAAPPSMTPGAVFWDCRGCPEMIVAPSGTLTIGSPNDEEGRRDDEGPQRTVRVTKLLAVGRFEITRDQYQAFLDATGHPVRGMCVTDRRKSGTWEPDPDTNFHDPGFAQAGNHPAACVSWFDAKAYIAWLNARTAGGYRLPSEAEWEYFARAGSTSAYPWGSDVDDGCPYMNGFDTTIVAQKGDLYGGETVPYATCSDDHLNTSPVGAYQPNAFGIFDTIGNLAEWTADCSSSSYEALVEDGTRTEQDCQTRMVRGGSWGTQPRQLRSAERIRYAPDALDDSIGFRVVKDLAPAK